MEKKGVFTGKGKQQKLLVGFPKRRWVWVGSGKRGEAFTIPVSASWGLAGDPCYVIFCWIKV